MPISHLNTSAPKVTITLTSNTIDSFHFNFQSLFISVSSFLSSHLCPLSFGGGEGVVSASVSEALSFHLSSSIKSYCPSKKFLCVLFLVSFLELGSPSLHCWLQMGLLYPWQSTLDPSNLTNLNSYKHCLLPDLKPRTILQFCSCSWRYSFYIWVCLCLFLSVSFGYSSVTTLWLKWCMHWAMLHSLEWWIV